MWTKGGLGDVSSAGCRVWGAQRSAVSSLNTYRYMIRMIVYTTYWPSNGIRCGYRLNRLYLSVPARHHRNARIAIATPYFFILLFPTQKSSTCGSLPLPSSPRSLYL